MAALGVRTKKVTTYGKKKTQIISVHNDFSTGAENNAPATPSSSILSGTGSAKRPPLHAKLSQDFLNIPPTPPALSHGSKGKPALPRSKLAVAHLADSPCSSPETTPIIKRAAQRKVNRPGRAVIPRSPSVSPVTMKGFKRSGRAVFDGVVLPSRRKSKLSSNLLDRFASVTIEDEPVDVNDAEEVNPFTTSSESSFSALLSACTVSTVQAFGGFLGSSTLVSTPTPFIRKVGEASFSEVFGVSSSSTEQGLNEIVLKIIPLLSTSTRRRSKENSEDKRGFPDCSSVEDVLREIEITKRMSGLPGGGFVHFRGAYVVEGTYPDELLEKWDLYKSTLGSASVRPGIFDATQQYALVVLSSSGLDLETFKFDSARGWVEAAGVFWQVADALARAEQWTRFEHRDMHEGQILLSPSPITSVSAEQVNGEGANYLSSSFAGVQSTIIDFGLSRLDLPGSSSSISAVAFSTLPQEVYQGKGAQWDLYRAMKERIGDDWDGYNPITNVMWLHYIVRYISQSRSLKTPKITLAPSSTPASLSSTTKNAAAAAVVSRKQIKAAQNERAYLLLTHVESVLASSIEASRGSTTRTRTRPRRGAAMDPVRELGSAGDVMSWGREMGWVV